MIRPRSREILERCINEGAIYGVGRAFKHTDKPEHETIAQEVEIAIMNEIYEYFDFDDTSGEAE